MESSNIIFYFIIICVVIALLIIFSKPIKLIIKFCVQSSICLSIIFVLNFIVSPNIYIGINYLNAIIVGLLGIPGLVSLYLMQFIL